MNRSAAIINAIPKTEEEIKKFQLVCLILKSDVKATENIITAIMMNNCPTSRPMLKEKSGNTTFELPPNISLSKVEKPSPCINPKKQASQ